MSLIAAIGAQNLFVIRQGVRRNHVGLVVMICTLSDVALIAAGIGGVATIIQGAPWIIVVARWGGGIFLISYGAIAGVRAVKGSAQSFEMSSATATVASRSAVAGTALALTWLNPHVYLDTVLLLGSVANTKSAPWFFGIGAGIASLVWFSALGFGSRYLARWLRTPLMWRIVDAIVTIIMIAFGVSLIAAH
nr:LysE/ArgO family amino acid transporter [Microbacterium halimionae]